MARSRLVVLMVVAAATASTSCSSSDGQPDRITRIDGPASVDDDDGSVSPQQSNDG